MPLPSGRYAAFVLIGVLLLPTRAVCLSPRRSPSWTTSPPRHRAAPGLPRPPGRRALPPASTQMLQTPGPGSAKKSPGGARKSPGGSKQASLADLLHRRAAATADGQAQEAAAAAEAAQEREELLQQWQGTSLSQASAAAVSAALTAAAVLLLPGLRGCYNDMLCHCGRRGCRWMLRCWRRCHGQFRRS